MVFRLVSQPQQYSGVHLQSGWDDLPLELLSKVAGGQDDLKAMTLVSKTWRTGYEDSVTRICLDMPRVEGLPLLPRFGRVHTLTLTGNLTNTGLWALRNSGVKALDLSGCSGVNEGLLDTLAGSLLESLALHGGEETGIGLGALRDLPTLNSITLTRVFYEGDSEDYIFPKLNNLPSLAKLHFSVESAGCDYGYIFEQIVDAVQGLPMRDLKLTGTSACDVLLEFDYFKGMSLTNLEVRYCHFIWDEDLIYLRGMPLTSLALWGVDWEDDDDDDKCWLSESGLNVLIGMPLTSLTLSRFSARPGCLEALRGLPLTSLSMAFEEDKQVSDAMAEIFFTLPLTKLELDNCMLTDNARARLHALPLESLRITD